MKSDIRTAKRGNITVAYDSERCHYGVAILSPKDRSSVLGDGDRMAVFRLSAVIPGLVVMGELDDDQKNAIIKFSLSWSAVPSFLWRRVILACKKATNAFDASFALWKIACRMSRIVMCCQMGPDPFVVVLPKSAPRQSIEDAMLFVDEIHRGLITESRNESDEDAEISRWCKRESDRGNFDLAVKDRFLSLMADVYDEIVRWAAAK